MRWKEVILVITVMGKTKVKGKILHNLCSGMVKLTSEREDWFLTEICCLWTEGS